MFYIQKIETFKYSEFMKKEHDVKQSKDIRLHSLTISPLAMFDPLVLFVAAGILSIVLLEKFLLKGSLFHLGEFLGTFINAISPILLFGAIIYFFITNPFLGWWLNAKETYR